MYVPLHCTQQLELEHCWLCSLEEDLQRVVIYLIWIEEGVLKDKLTLYWNMTRLCGDKDQDSCGFSMGIGISGFFTRKPIRGMKGTK